jgi:site-specific recombinase XerD
MGGLPGESSFIITDFTQQQPLTARHLHHIFKNLAENTALKFSHDLDKANRIRKFSPHWLRHFAASMQRNSGITLGHIQENLPF